jgi:hypothetical protein
MPPVQEEGTKTKKQMWIAMQKHVVENLDEILAYISCPNVFDMPDHVKDDNHWGVIRKLMDHMTTEVMEDLTAFQYERTTIHPDDLCGWANKHRRWTRISQLIKFARFEDTKCCDECKSTVVVDNTIVGMKDAVDRILHAEQRMYRRRCELISKMSEKIATIPPSSLKTLDDLSEFPGDYEDNAYDHMQQLFRDADTLMKKTYSSDMFQ